MATQYLRRRRGQGARMAGSGQEGAGRTPQTGAHQAPTGGRDLARRPWGSPLLGFGLGWGVGLGVGEPGEEDLERDERMESPVSSRLGVCGLLAFYVLPDLVVVLNTLKSWTSLRHRTVPQATKIVNDTE
ncbi:hypothetical protein BHM03_00020767 [Ensete ventricosum]|nr:hypothetical protein BHM03_00020767 [Ensete ventricosum]